MRRPQAAKREITTRRQQINRRTLKPRKHRSLSQSSNASNTQLTQDRLFTQTKKCPELFGDMRKIPIEEGNRMKTIRDLGRTLCLFIAFVAIMSLAWSTSEAKIQWVTRNSVVWGQQQTVIGRSLIPGATSGTLLLSGTEVPFVIPAPNDTFTVQIRIGEGITPLVARIDSAGVPKYSDTLRLTLGYNLRPDAFAYASAVGRSVTLHCAILDNPDSASCTFSWTADARNPAAISLSNAQDSVALCDIPVSAPSGEYYFTCVVTSSRGDIVTARTIVTTDTAMVRPFDIIADHAQWIDSAIVYEIDPYTFVTSSRFADIAAKFADLASLGINAVWIQPIFPGGMYTTEDYFSFVSAFGTAQDLKNLVQSAHAHGIRVLLDLVPNHSSIMHPYAQDAITYGPQSHYFDFYQRTFDTAPYSQHYVLYTQGLMTFVFYRFFGSYIPNFNFNNPEVQRMFIEVGKYWIEHFDIDGYRVDAVWAIDARTPSFMQLWRKQLKSAKPDILLLAEDKATWSTPFDGRFDLAFDWYPEQAWVSHWVWQPFWVTGSSPTIFSDIREGQRADSLRASLTNHGLGYDPRAKILRFMENNDLPGFYEIHGLAMTKMVAALMFSLHGVPLLYCGQEVGNHYGFYSPYASIQSTDFVGLFPFYRMLCRMRKGYPALYGKQFQEVPVNPDTSLLAFRRWDRSQNLFGVINMGSKTITATLHLPVQQLDLDSMTTYYLTDILADQYFSGTPRALASLNVSMNSFSTRVLVLDTKIIQGVGPASLHLVPGVFELAQNYPNPFNPRSVIRYQLPMVSNVSLAVFDLLGREVAVLVDERKAPGSYEVQFDASRFASGVYFYRLRAGDFVATKKMLLLK